MERNDEKNEESLTSVVGVFKMQMIVRSVKHQQRLNDPLRLMLVEFEANAILYTSDQNLSAVSNVR